MPNGVICGGAVDGSNQLGEIVTCQAMVTRPDGSALPAVAPIAPKAATASRTRAIGNQVMATALAIEMAGDRAALDLLQRRALDDTARHGVRAARMEVAAARRIERARHLAGQHHVVAP